MVAVGESGLTTPSDERLSRGNPAAAQFNPNPDLRIPRLDIAIAGFPSLKKSLVPFESTGPNPGGFR